jgi:hypothetical protein
VTAPARRVLVRSMTERGLSDRRALAVVGMSASALRYAPRRSSPAASTISPGNGVFSTGRRCGKDTWRTRRLSGTVLPVHQRASITAQRHHTTGHRLPGRPLTGIEPVERDLLLAALTKPSDRFII